MSAEHKQLVLDFVRGYRDWTSLSAAGLLLDWSGDSLNIRNPSALVVKITPKDISKGLTKLAGNYQDLRTWASVILAGSTFLDLDKQFEEWAEGEQLLETLWDVSFGQRPSPEALQVARRILDSGCR